MTVDPEKAAGSFEQDGTTYYFCSNGCLENFKAKTAQATAPAAFAASGSVQIGRVKHVHQPDEMRIDKAGTHIDSVCKMLVSPETAAGEFEHGVETFYFCSKGCRERFAADPQKFLQPAAA